MDCISCPESDPLGHVARDPASRTFCPRAGDPRNSLSCAAPWPEFALPTAARVGHQPTTSQVVITAHSRPPSHEVDHLDLVPFVHLRCVVSPALQYHEVVLDSHAARIDVQLPQQLADRESTLYLERLAVEHDFQ